MSNSSTIIIQPKYFYECKDINYYRKVKTILENRICWFCERPCDSFVCICSKCKSEKLKNKNNIFKS